MAEDFYRRVNYKIFFLQSLWKNKNVFSSHFDEGKSVGPTTLGDDDKGWYQWGDLHCTLDLWGDLQLGGPTLVEVLRGPKTLGGPNFFGGTYNPSTYHV